MTLTYIFHSGFVLETKESILIFDYWLDLNGVVVMFPLTGALGMARPLEAVSSSSDSRSVFLFPCTSRVPLVASDQRSSAWPVASSLLGE